MCFPNLLWGILLKEFPRTDKRIQIEVAFTPRRKKKLTVFRQLYASRRKLNCLKTSLCYYYSYTRWNYSRSRRDIWNGTKIRRDNFARLSTPLVVNKRETRDFHRRWTNDESREIAVRAANNRRRKGEKKGEKKKERKRSANDSDGRRFNTTVARFCRKWIDIRRRNRILVAYGETSSVLRSRIVTNVAGSLSLSLSLSLPPLSTWKGAVEGCRVTHASLFRGAPR